MVLYNFYNWGNKVRSIYLISDNLCIKCFMWIQVGQLPNQQSISSCIIILTPNWVNWHIVHFLMSSSLFIWFWACLEYCIVYSSISHDPCLRLEIMLPKPLTIDRMWSNFLYLIKFNLTQFLLVKSFLVWLGILAQTFDKFQLLSWITSIICSVYMLAKFSESCKTCIRCYFGNSIIQ